MDTCNMFWGSHGCDLPEGHPGQHHCLSCCEPNDPVHMKAHRDAFANQYGADGCAGTWPYYGILNMTGEGTLQFFSLNPKPDYGFINHPEEFSRLSAIAKQEA